MSDHSTQRRVARTQNPANSQGYNEDTTRSPHLEYRRLATSKDPRLPARTSELILAKCAKIQKCFVIKYQQSYTSLA
jgi:hypothetical protein